MVFCLALGMVGGGLEVVAGLGVVSVVVLAWLVVGGGTLLATGVWLASSPPSATSVIAMDNILEFIGVLVLAGFLLSMVRY